MTEHISPAQLRTRIKGSRVSHESLVEAVRVKLAYAGIEAFPIYTGGIPKYIPGGELVLQANPHQIGIADMILMYRDVAFVGGTPVAVGRLALLEMKTGGARRAPAQVRIEKHFTSYGALCVLVRSVEDVDFIIAAHRKSTEAMAWQSPSRSSPSPSPPESSSTTRREPPRTESASCGSLAAAIASWAEKRSRPP